MELDKYDLQPQEQLAVALYLKTMNKSQAARDAGLSSPAAFNKDNVKSAIAEQLSIRAERLRLGGDWVLSELKRVYDRCMQMEKILDRDGNPTGELQFDATNAIKTLALIGKHVDVKAFDIRDSRTTDDSELVKQLKSARLRAAKSKSIETADNSISFF